MTQCKRIYVIKQFLQLGMMVPTVRYYGIHITPVIPPARKTTRQNVLSLNTLEYIKIITGPCGVM